MLQQMFCIVSCSIYFILFYTCGRL